MKKRLHRWWMFWVDLFSHQERGTSIAVFRIAVGCVVLYSLWSVAAAGLVETLWVDVKHGGMRHVRGNWFVRKLGGTTPGTVWGLYWAGIVLSGMVIVGVGGRLSTFLLCQVYGALVGINGDASGGSDSMMLNALWLLTLAKPTATLALDCRLRDGGWTSERLISAWPRYLIILQLFIVYGATGLQKTGIAWTPAGGYSALYFALQDPTWTRFDPGIFADLYILTQIGTAITWHWEQLTPILLLWFYFRYTPSPEQPGRLRRWLGRWDLRKPWAIIGVGLHMGILLTMNVGPFSLISMAYYVCLWRAEEVEAAWARLKRRLRRERATVASDAA